MWMRMILFTFRGRRGNGYGDHRRPFHVTSTKILIHLSHITLPEGSESSITDRDFTIAGVAAPSALKSSEDEAEAAEAEEGEEGEEGAEGEATEGEEGGSED